jgi:hypothetical protein
MIQRHVCSPVGFMDCCRACVSATLPLAARLHSLPLARRRPRRGGERRRARLFLPRLLLDADGAPVRRRDHEPRLDCRHRAVGSDREDPALGQADQPIDGCRARRLGCRHPGRCGLTMSHNKKHGGDTVDRSWVRSPLPRNIIFILAAPSSCTVLRVGRRHGRWRVPSLWLGIFLLLPRSACLTW